MAPRARKPTKVIESESDSEASSAGSSSSSSSRRPAAPSKKSKAAANGKSSKSSKSSKSITKTVKPPDSTASQAINDDSREKASRRRQSAGGGLLAPPLTEADGVGGGKGKGKRLSALAGDGEGVEGGGGTAGGEGRKVVPETMEVMSSKFEEWMKMATDNKINVTNTWNFALIDYFADLTLLRNGPDDQSINFQKASCTLDGCVKIWTSRVDSVATETGKLLSGLATELTPGKGGDGEEDGEDGEGGEGSDGEGNGEGGGEKKKRKSAKSSTLAPSFSTLSTKKIDLEVSVDPLFKKTCADFDEGGAGGLLMNHLGVDGSGKLVFDAGDAGLDVDEEEEEEEEGEEEDGKGGEGKRVRRKDVKIDVSGLKEKYLPDLLTPTFQTLKISPTLSSFVFSSTVPDASLAFDFSSLSEAMARQTPPPAPHPDSLINPSDGAPAGGGADFFDDDDGGGGEMGGMDLVGDEGGFSYDDPSVDPDAEDYDGDAQHAHAMLQSGTSRFEPFDPRKTSALNGRRDLVMAMVGAAAAANGGTGGGEEGGMEEMFDLFDGLAGGGPGGGGGGGGKGWAGPEHWKMRKVIGGPKKDEDEPTTPKARKPKAPPFQIDFLSPTPPVPTHTLFLAAPTKSSINLPKSRKTTSGKVKALVPEEEQERYLLPGDLHFSSGQLLRLFMKKKFTLKMRKQDQAKFDAARGDTEVDEEFWAAQAAAQAQDLAGNDDDDGFGTQGDDPIPFSTQFFHDDGLDTQPGADLLDPDSSSEAGVDLDADPNLAVLPKEEEESNNLWAGTQGLRRSRPDFVKYAKRAKRVDVKKLKDSIWKGLEIFAPALEGEEEDEVDERSPPAPNPSDPPAPPRVFSSVVSSLRRTYPSDKLADISTSYCFICLLHLCNERGLQIETDRAPRVVGMNDDEAPYGAAPGEGEQVDDDRFGVGEGEKMVGELGWLKISKDRDAKGHA